MGIERGGGHAARPTFDVGANVGDERRPLSLGPETAAVSLVFKAPGDGRALKKVKEADVPGRRRRERSEHAARFGEAPLEWALNPLSLLTSSPSLPRPPPRPSPSRSLRGGDGR